MKKIFFMILCVFVLSVFLVSCETAEPEKVYVMQNTAETAIDTPNLAEKVYTVNVLENADFYYYTSSKKLYKYTGGNVTQTYITSTVTQENAPTITEQLEPIEFYKLGYMYFFTVVIDGNNRFFKQLYGEIIEVDADGMMRHPDCVNVQMNNSRFSITNNIWTTYTVSDIRNLTLNTGASRTIKCTGYFVGSYLQYYDYGLWFATQDDISLLRSGLYFYPENDTAPIKVIDEAGELW